jgi:hypothetical protein
LAVCLVLEKQKVMKRKIGSESCEKRQQMAKRFSQEGVIPEE